MSACNPPDVTRCGDRKIDTKPPIAVRGDADEPRSLFRLARAAVGTAVGEKLLFQG